jgi:PIN domain nuclease of toxin-antitoxin system
MCCSPLYRLRSSTSSKPRCPLDGEKLSSLALAAINDPAATIFVSAASGWELATKGCLGKPGAEGLLQDLPSLLQKQGFQPLAVQLHHGVHAGGYRQAQIVILAPPQSPL